MVADGNAFPEREVWKESEHSFQAKYKSYGSFIYIKNSKVCTEEIYIKQWNGDPGSERKCMWYDAQQKYETIQEIFFKEHKEEGKKIKKV